MYVFTESFYHNGQLEYKVVVDPYSYEGYNEDGTPDTKTQKNIERKKASKVHDEKLSKAIAMAIERAMDGKYNDARNYLRDEIYEHKRNVRGREISEARVRAWDTVKEITAMEEKEKEKLQQEKQEKEKQKKEVELAIEALNKDIAEFTSKHKVGKPSPILVDENGKPIMTYSYPNGKHFYKKSIVLINEEVNKVVDDKQIDSSTKKKQLSSLADFINKLNGMSSSETKELNKKLKKASNADEVKQLLGYSN